ncbi:MAG TPA: ABC transporter ATP-binding protein [Candidatus Limnocylindrales bacterium]
MNVALPGVLARTAPAAEVAGAASAAGPAALPAGPAIELTNVSKAFGRGADRLVAVDGLTLSVADHDFVCLVGASGCGKTTLLNMVAGLDQPSSGAVRADSQPALIFQEAGLFPWLTARGNVELALQLRGVPRRLRRPQAEELLARVHLAGFGERRPHELSGGMRQRVALARALAQNARILLMDEPFGALDAMTRDLLHDELERLWMELGLTILFVTHNVREAVRLGERVVLMSSRPGRAVAEFAVPFQRPRRIEASDVSLLSSSIRDRLGEEVRRHAR